MTRPLPAPWRILSSRMIVADRWMRLRADCCETEDGSNVDPFYVIESPDMVAAVALTPSEDLVLVRQYRHAYGATTLELPAGLVDRGEDPPAACLRELREETGYVGASAQLLRSWSPNPARYANRIHAMLIRAVESIGSAEDDPSERIETVLWPLRRAGDLLLEPEFVNSSQAGILAVGLAALRA